MPGFGRGSEWGHIHFVEDPFRHPPSLAHGLQELCPKVPAGEGHPDPLLRDWGQSAIFYRRWDIHNTLDFDGKIGLSSIGPDDYVMSEAYFIDFLGFALECNFFVVAWDVPTYVDIPTNISLQKQKGSGD